MTDDPRYEVENEELKALLHHIAGKLTQAMPKGFGFNLIIFEMNKMNGAVFFISSAERQDTIKILTEVCNKYRKQ